MTRLGRIIATVVAISVGASVLAGYFLDAFSSLSFIILGWAAIVIAFTLMLGVVNVLRVHINKIRTLEKGWFYSAVLIIALALTLIVGRNGPNSVAGQSLFDNILRPLEASLFALMAFFVVSAAYRAFRMKNFEMALFVLFAIIVLLGQVPAGFQLWPDLPLIKEWIMRVPALAGARGILLGVSLGTVATGLRVLLGADRPYADVE